MPSEPGGAWRLARRLRDLRVNEWPDTTITQQHLATAFTAKAAVGHTTVSSWESLTSPKTPPVLRLDQYALFFCSRRSMAGAPHLLDVDGLDEDEEARYAELRAELLDLHARVQEDAPVEEERRALLSFPDDEPVVVICPQAPASVLGALANEEDVNHNRLHRYADLDALIEMFGHLRALNPRRHVLHRLSVDVQQIELQNHLVLIGGIGWNRTVRTILKKLRELPIEQYDDPRLKTGEPFRVTKDVDREEKIHFPVTEEFDGRTEMVEDVALVARLANPFNSSRTLTICNGVHSKGVLGAVMTLTDETVRPNNEQYLARRFPAGAFAMLVSVPVVSGKVLAPDLQNAETRLFEWAPEPAATGG